MVIPEPLLIPLLIFGIPVVILMTYLCYRTFTSGFLNENGMTALLIFLIPNVLCGVRYAFLLLAFFFTLLWKEHDLNLNRGFKHVVDLASLPTFLVMVAASITRGVDTCLDTSVSSTVTILVGGVIGYYASCNGDTWLHDDKKLPPKSRVTAGVIVGEGDRQAPAKHAVAFFTGFLLGMVYSIGIAVSGPECSSHEQLVGQFWIIPSIAAVAGLFGSKMETTMVRMMRSRDVPVTNRRGKVTGTRKGDYKIGNITIFCKEAKEEWASSVAVWQTTILTGIVCWFLF